jgi:Glutamyl-tRNAGlu reductase, dimerisation domain
MGSARVNPAVTRIRSWAEELRAEEADRALRQLQNLSAKDRKTLVSLTKKLVDKVLTSPRVFANQDSDAFPNSRRLSIVCNMFDRQGARCDASHCVAVDALEIGAPLEENCGMPIIINERNRRASR